MRRTAVITTRVDPHLKQNAEQIFAQLGMTTAQAINMFLKQVELNQGLPFTLRLPETVKIATKPFKVEIVSLGQEVQVDRDELYAARSL